MAVYTDDDEELIQDEDQRKKPNPDQPEAEPIGKPLTYGPSEPANVKALNTPMPKPYRASDPFNANPPESTGAMPSEPASSTIGSMAPYKPSEPAAPRPQSQAFTDWQAQDLEKHPAGQPRYHGIARVADTIAGVTNIGRLAEQTGEFGTLGAEAKANRLAHNAAQEDTQIKYGQSEREANAKLEGEQVKAEGEQTGNELVDVSLPDGTKTQVMRKNLASPTSAIINTAGREKVADTNANARTDVADINAGAREETARINVNGKAMATKTVVGPDGTPHVMMWNSATHTFDKDLGKAPPPTSTSSAYAATRTVTLTDPETGIPTVFLFDPATKTYSKKVGTSASGAYGHEMAQSGAVERAGQGLIQEIKTNRDKIGDVGAIWNSAFTGTPLSDRFQSGLAAQIASFAALNPALHGARGVSAMKEFEKIYGSPINNPDSLIAAIEAGMKTAGYIKPPKEKPSGSTQGRGNAQGGAAGSGPLKFSDWQKSQGQTH